MHTYLISALLLVSTTLLSSTVSSAHDHMGMHSLFPPILSNYWDNGLNYWSFGSESVVTDDMVRLTQSTPKSHGYLWNRHANHLQAWELNVTLQMGKILEDTSSKFVANDDDLAMKKEIDADTTGVGIWFTTETPRRGDRSFFGAPNRFIGVGVTIDHKSVISVFVSDGYEPITDIAKQRRGFCRATTKAITIAVTYSEAEKTLKVMYYPEDTFYDSASAVDKLLREAQAADPNRVPFLHSLAGNCASLTGIKLNSHAYFGMTASNTAANMARIDVQKFFVTPIGGVTDEAEELVGLKMFDRVLEVEQKKAATGHDDKPLPPHLRDHNGFNFPRQEGEFLRRKKHGGQHDQ